MTKLVTQEHVSTQQHEYFRKDLLSIIKAAHLEHRHACKKTFARFTLHHHHGKKGRSRSAELLAKCETIDTVEDIMATLDHHMRHGKGNTYPNSFKTILAKKLKDRYRISMIQNVGVHSVCGEFRRHLDEVFRKNYTDEALPANFIL